jgi:hypothetical protein
MKIIIAVAIFLMSCTTAKKEDPPQNIAPARQFSQTYVDSLVGAVRLSYQVTIDSLRTSCDSVKMANGLLAGKNKKLGRDLFVSRYQFRQLCYYVDIVINNPSQLKFLKGWKNRAKTVPPE